MTLAVQEGMVPGRCLDEKLDHAAGCGFEGIKLLGDGLCERFDPCRKRDFTISWRWSAVSDGVFR